MTVRSKCLIVIEKVSETVFVYMYMYVVSVVVIAGVLVGRDSSSPAAMMNGMKLVKLSAPRSDSVSITKKICLSV